MSKTILQEPLLKETLVTAPEEQRELEERIRKEVGEPEYKPNQTQVMLEEERKALERSLNAGSEATLRDNVNDVQVHGEYPKDYFAWLETKLSTIFGRGQIPSEEEALRMTLCLSREELNLLPKLLSEYYALVRKEKR